MSKFTKRIQLFSGENGHNLQNEEYEGSKYEVGAQIVDMFKPNNVAFQRWVSRFIVMTASGARR